MIFRNHLRTIPFAAALGLFALAMRGGLAQEASPGPSPIEIAMLGKGMPANAPGNYLELDRVTIAPGGAIPTHVHPGAYVLYVDAGDFGFILIKGEAQLLRAGETTPEALPVGKETVGHAGDAFFENGGTVHSARDAGTTPVVLLTAGLLANDQPSITMSNDQGTLMP